MNRDVRIDVLRALAIILIVMAHINPPFFIFQLRTFDVPAMALLLGMSFALSKRYNRRETYLNYVIKRFKRLIIPTWVFLTIFFLFVFFVGLVSRIEFPYNFTTIITSYTLISGIGYVWIIRVFFIIAIFSPILYFLSKKVQKTTFQTTIFFLLLIFQSILCQFSTTLPSFFGKAFQDLVGISFGYLICAFIGMWVVNFDKMRLKFFSLISLVVFIIIGVFTSFPPVNNQKYPPTPYFLSYGIGISLLFLVLLTNEKVTIFYSKCTLVKWLSMHSIEIYYWHIFPVTFFSYFFPDINWIVKFILTLCISMILTKFQERFLPNLFRFN